jgi:DNA-binding NtrC family response regulator
MSLSSSPVYVVDDDVSVREAVGSLIRSAGLRAETFGSAQEFLASPRAKVPSCLVLDMHLPGLSGLDLQQELAKADAQIPIIFLTGHGDIPTTVRAMKAGALEFLTKPFNDEDLLNAIRQGIAIANYHTARQPCRSVAQQGLEGIIGMSAALQSVLHQVEQVAASESTVLILGETGTGKELIARAIHKRSQRSTRAFVGVNCSAIPPDLLASELFGHEKGAFTGAVQRRVGRFELAQGGTLFLDEIGELRAATQVALLRVLQEHEFERVGGTGSIRTDARVIAATNRDLQAAIEAGTFRSDLFYRLNVFPIEMPPLRKRRKDIPLLAEYFIDLYAKKVGKSGLRVNQETLGLLQSQSWPGNIRELQNVIERSVILCGTENFSLDENWLSTLPPATEPNGRLGLSETVAAQEKRVVSAPRESGRQPLGPSGAAIKLGS